MKLDLGKGLKDLEGMAIMAADEEPATLRGVIIGALMAMYKGEDDLPGEEKLKRWELALKIKNAEDPVDLKSEEIVLIKKLVGKAYGTIIVGNVWTALEGGN